MRGHLLVISIAVFFVACIVLLASGVRADRRSVASLTFSAKVTDVAALWKSCGEAIATQLNTTNPSIPDSSDVPTLQMSLMSAAADDKAMTQIRVNFKAASYKYNAANLVAAISAVNMSQPVVFAPSVLSSVFVADEDFSTEEPAAEHKLDVGMTVAGVILAVLCIICVIVTVFMMKDLKY